MTTRSPFLPQAIANTTIVEVITHDAIASRAKELWLELGCPQNRDEEIWLEAEAELRATQEGRLRHPHCRNHA